MKTIATGVYLQTLREGKKFSRSHVADVLNTNEMQIQRIESGKVDTRGSLLFAYVKLLEGSTDDVSQLLLDEKKTEEDGRNLALQRMMRIKQPNIQNDNYDDYGLEQALEVAIALRKNRRLAQWVEVGRRLAAE